MSLGDFFPQGMKAESVDRSLRPGMVVKFEAIMDDGDRHLKRWIILDVTEKTFTCVINSAVARFHIGTPIESLHIPMPAAPHPFMSHDSTVDCSRIRTYLTDDVKQHLLVNPADVLGEITRDMRDEVVAAIKASPLISPMEATQCCRALEAANLKE